MPGKCVSRLDMYCQIPHCTSVVLYEVVQHLHGVGPLVGTAHTYIHPDSDRPYIHTPRPSTSTHRPTIHYTTSHQYTPVIYQYHMLSVHTRTPTYTIFKFGSLHVSINTIADTGQTSIHTRPYMKNIRPKIHRPTMHQSTPAVIHQCPPAIHQYPRIVAAIAHIAFLREVYILHVFPIICLSLVSHFFIQCQSFLQSSRPCRPTHPMFCSPPSPLSHVSKCVVPFSYMSY